MTFAEPAVERTTLGLPAQPPAPMAIAVVEAVRRFAGGRGVGPVDFDVRAGETFALMGANGAGKTTLLRMLATLGRPDSGVVRWWGEASPTLARRSIGFSPDVPVEEETLSPRQTTYFWCRQWIRDNTMSSVLLRHFPALSPALVHVKNAFWPWNTVRMS